MTHKQLSVCVSGPDCVQYWPNFPVDKPEMTTVPLNWATPRMYVCKNENNKHSHSNDKIEGYVNSDKSDSAVRWLIRLMWRTWEVMQIISCEAM